MGKHTAILPEPLNSIKICLVIFIALLLQFQVSISSNTKTTSFQIDNIPKFCVGDVFIMQVFDETTPVSRVDSLYFISKNDTLKFKSPMFTGKDTLLLAINTASLNMTGDIAIWTFVLRDGKPQKRVSFIRIVPQPKIIQHPLDHYACQGDRVIFNFKGTNYDSIRWEFISPNSSQWNFYGNEYKSDLIISANKSLNDRFQFRAVLSNENTCFTYTSAGTLTLDSIKPRVICPNDTIILIDDVSCSYLFAIRPRPLSIYDICGHNESTTRRSDNKQATEPYPLGTTAVTFLVFDKSGNLGECSYKISIQNNATTKIPCNPEEIIYLDQTCRAQVRDRPLQVKPPCEPNTIPVFYTGALNYSRQGNYTIQYFASHNKVEECVTQVTVLDTFSYKMVYKPDENITHDTDPGKCTRTIYPDPPRITGSSCTSNRDKVELLNEWPENNEFLIGTTEIEWGIFQYNGKVDTIKQMITIRDVSVPTVDCPGTFEAYLEPGRCSGWFDIPRLSEGGACGPVTISNNITGKDDASGNYGAGEFTINWSVTASNNFAETCPQKIIIYSHPTARRDSANTVQDIPVIIPILDNDDDCINPGLLLASLPGNSLPLNGIASIDGNQRLVYTPNTGFFGIDSLKYLITNTQNLASEAWVVISVAEEPEPLVCEITNRINATGFGVPDGSATVSVTGGIVPYSFQWSNGQTTATAVNLPAGKHIVTIFDSGDQSTSCDVTITEPEELTCEAFILMKISVFGANDGKATVTVIGGTAPYTYLWDNGQISAQADGLKAGKHTVKVTDFNRYETTCNIDIEEPLPPVEPCRFLIPDGFSPNGDGIGDRFYIRCIEEYPNASIQIFNRYGQLVYQQNNYGNTGVWGETGAFWDGRPNRGIKPFNSILPSGTYFYVFNPGGGSKPATGSIYLNTNREGMQ
jgi:gliding motility-associated-like protein